MSFYQKLRSIQRKNNSLLCVGLDPDIKKIPKFLLQHGNPVFEFNKRIIDATRDLVCAYKINLAFYEALGASGWYTIHQTLAAIPKGIITIGDGKRGDIGNSSELYAQALMDDHGFTASTVNPYMGHDSVSPFMKSKQHGVFVLVLTSNSGAKDMQYLKVGSRPLYEHVAAKVRKWNVNLNCGLVVGATRPKDLARVRTLAPEMPLLIPGIGAQGGDLQAAVRYGCDKRSEMAIINASRSIIYASRGEDFASAARTAAVTLRDEINEYRKTFFRPKRQT
ncbi:MAG: orotidine-5'-phosphate decarboxylase [Ignavibacteriae bacterium]|nr:orotidine-5'-phosphate decarboxylase [Ignavibacteriota bacterium]